MATRVQVVHEARELGEEGAWVLCFRWCEYHYEDGTVQGGYRFIWRRPDGTLQPARGQARIPSVARLERLLDDARAGGRADLAG